MECCNIRKTSFKKYSHPSKVPLFPLCAACYYTANHNKVITLENLSFPHSRIASGYISHVWLYFIFNFAAFSTAAKPFVFSVPTSVQSSLLAYTFVKSLFLDEQSTVEASSWSVLMTRCSLHLIIHFAARARARLESFVCLHVYFLAIFLSLWLALWFIRLIF